jgi:hypothetical protein
LLEGHAVLRRFVLAFLAFVGLIIPATFVLALLMAPPTPAAPMETTGCDRNLADANASVTALQARVKSIGAARGPEICNVTRLYFLEMVKARAVTALCKTGPDRDRELGRLDADVEHINEAIAGRCG